jgi:hypothetical protein
MVKPAGELQETLVFFLVQITAGIRKSRIRHTGEKLLYNPCNRFARGEVFGRKFMPG